MLNSKICRQHAAKCIETAETIPPGAQHEMFFDMAKRWTDLAINIESSEALADPALSPANDPGEPYRFGSRIVKTLTDQGIIRALLPPSQSAPVRASSVQRDRLFLPQQTPQASG